MEMQGVGGGKGLEEAHGSRPLAPVLTPRGQIQILTVWPEHRLQANVLPDTIPSTFVTACEGHLCWPSTDEDPEGRRG